MSDRREVTAIEAGMMMQIRELEGQRDALVKAGEAALKLLDQGKPGWGVSRDILRAALAKAREGQP